ncbi:protein of unknown function [Palleronia marisminoris]|uniref:Conserved hypothetical protein CHP03032 domain-containing protein n=2 Tax=Palleronia marisminoris TaxID=315423 RepID=A0A1Y5SA09_9RHOB|nr:protein of unknown function [Palleronia marisminoris]SLN34364.1 hypothetical protein PAM7066_01438 [Palleronia marisminoris]
MGEGDEDGTPRYVTAVSRSDTIDGWPDRRASGGVVVDVATGASFGRILTARNVALAEAVSAFALLVGFQFVVATLRYRSRRIEHLVTASPDAGSLLAKRS